MIAALPTGVKIASFAEGYRKHFEVVPALSDALRAHNYRIRHEVYCKELGIQPTRNDQIEVDEYDTHAVHCLVRAVATHSFVGCARIVLVNPANPKEPLPFEKAFAAPLRGRFDPSRVDRHKIGEISRLAVVGQYRRREGERDSPFSVSDDFGGEDGLRLPYMTLGLYLAMIALAQWKGVETLYMLADTSLANSIARLGIELNPIGPALERTGGRFPCALPIDEVISELDPRVRMFFETIRSEINLGIEAIY